MELYEKIKDLRERNNISQKEFAQLLNISPSTYNSYEKGNSTYTAPMLKKICEVLHCSSDELLGLNANVTIEDRMILNEIKGNKITLEHISLLTNLLNVDNNNDYK